MQLRFKFISILITLLVSFSLLSQNNVKKTIYLFNNKEITQSEFNKLNLNKFFIKETEFDSIIVKDIRLNKILVNLNDKEKESFFKFIEKNTNKKFNKQKQTLIHFYSLKERIPKNDPNFRSYKNWLQDNSSKYQSYIFLKPNSEKNRKRIFIDKDNFIENLFFSKSPFDINHIFINSKQEIYVYYGIEDLLFVLDWSV